MASLFGWVTGETAITAPDTVSHKSNFVAQASLRAIQSLATRISVFRAATETVLQPAQKEEFEKLIAVLRKRAGERNDVVHGQWCTFDRFPDELLLNVTTPTSGFVLQRYTEADLEQIIVRILELRDRLHHFGIDCVMNRVMHHEQALQALAALKPPPLGE